MLTVINSTTFYIKWNNPETQNHNGIIRYYFIRVHEVETARNFSFTSEETTVEMTLFHPSFTYVLAVAAVTVEEGPFSEAIMATADEDSKYC